MEYAIVFLIVFLLISSGLLLLFYREVLGQRLAAILGGHAKAAAPAPAFRGPASTFFSFAESLQKIVPKSEEEVSSVQKRLVKAGFRRDDAAAWFYASKIILPLVLCLVVFLTGVYRWNPFFVFLPALGAGYLTPDYVLDHLITTRGQRLREDLPDALDLLVVCLEAGLSLDQSVMRAVDELRFSHPVMTDELGLVMLEVRAGRPRAEAWRSLTDRTDVDSVRMVVSILVQSDKYGTGISKTLRIHSETMRTSRKQRIEEMAAKTTVKLLFPLVFFIFPTLLVVLLGPALLIISDGLKL